MDANRRFSSRTHTHSHAPRRHTIQLGAHSTDIRFHAPSLPHKARPDACSFNILYGQEHSACLCCVIGLLHICTTTHMTRRTHLQRRRSCRPCLRRLPCRCRCPRRRHCTVWALSPPARSGWGRTRAPDSRTPVTETPPAWTKRDSAASWWRRSPACAPDARDRDRGRVQESASAIYARRQAGRAMDCRADRVRLATVWETMHAAEDV
jgi:hypothetical protein